MSIDYSALPLAKPVRAERKRKGLARTGAIKPNPERAAAREAEQIGPHGELVRALPCAVRNPELYRTDRALVLALKAAAQRVAEARAAGLPLPRKSAAHHTIRRSQGGLARDLIPLHDLVHDEAHRHGDFNRYLLDAHGLDSLALAARLWEHSPVCAAEEGEAE